MKFDFKGEYAAQLLSSRGYMPRYSAACHSMEVLILTPYNKRLSWDPAVDFLSSKLKGRQCKWRFALCVSTPHSGIPRTYRGFLKVFARLLLPLLLQVVGRTNTLDVICLAFCTLASQQECEACTRAFLAIQQSACVEPQRSLSLRTSPR